MEQVHSYEEAEDDEPGFSTSPCMMALVEMSKGKKLMDRKSELTKKRKMRCGNCDKCMKVDCDYCTGCTRTRINMQLILWSRFIRMKKLKMTNRTSVLLLA